MSAIKERVAVIENMMPSIVVFFRLQVGIGGGLKNRRVEPEGRERNSSVTGQSCSITARHQRSVTRQ